MSGLGNMITGRAQKKARKQAAEATALAEKNRKEVQATELAINQRARIAEEGREEDLSADRSNTLRALRARQRGRSRLAFQGSNSGKRETLGVSA